MQVGLDLSDSCSFSPKDSVDTVGNETSNDHEDNRKGEDYTTNVQACTKCLMKDAVHQAIILVLGVDSCIEVELKTTSYGAQFHHGSLNFPGFSVMCSGFGRSVCERGDSFARL